MHEIKKYSYISIGLIAVSVLVAISSGLGKSVDALQLLFIASPDTQGFESILSGQVWRLITPIFIHFGVAHLLFNMMATWDLGRVIEANKGSLFFVIFVLVTGVASNIVQYLFTDSPFFGGMSGVLYGLFGYIWIQGRTNRNFGLVLNQNVVMMMLGWYVLCWTGLLGPVANWAHTAGLLTGAIWGYLDKNKR